MTPKAVVIVADTHNGHPFALPPNSEGWDYIDGGRKPITPWQEIIAQHWEESWRFVGDLRKKAELIVVHAGDPIEGVHHGIVQLLTQRVDEQERQHVEAMGLGLDYAKFNPRKDKLIYLAGTDAHGGLGNSSTERIMRELLRTDRLDGRAIRDRLLCSFNDGDVFDVAHKGFRLGGREWTTTNSMRAYLTSQWFKSLKNKRRLPRHIIRAHYHTFGHAALEDDEGDVISEAWLMPAWKIKDDYVYSFAPEAVSSIGMLVFYIDNQGHSTAHKRLMRIEQDDIEEL